MVNYDGAPQSAPSAPGIGSIAEFMAENENEVPQLGLAVRQDQRKLNSGEAITGLLVESVSPASPAAIAGIKGFQRKVLTAIEAVAMVAGMAFPPAAPVSMLVPVLESAHVGEHYDLIVAVDGYRVSNTMDFQDCMRDAQPGQTVYLSVVRDGKRMQVPVKMPG